jgi:hypothetical protein
MNTNALAFMRLGVDHQVGLHSEPFGHGTSETLISVYPLFKSIRKQSFGFTSGLNRRILNPLKCATNFRLYNQFGRLAKVYSGYK